MSFDKVRTKKITQNAWWLEIDKKNDLRGYKVHSKYIIEGGLTTRLAVRQMGNKIYM